MDNSEKIEKLYYSIKEVSDIVGLSQSAIRNHELNFKLRIGRNRRGDRSFTKNNIAEYQKIKELLYIEGYSLKGAIKKYFNQKG